MGSWETTRAELNETMSLADGAADKGCSVKTLRRAIADGRLPASLVEGRYQFTALDWKVYCWKDDGTGPYRHAAQIAAEAGIDVTQVNRDIKRGILPGEKFGGKWVVRVEDVDAYVAAKADSEILIENLSSWIRRAKGELLELDETNHLAQEAPEAWVRSLAMKLGHPLGKVENPDA